ncbi:hypothetical protein BABINDRAFT_11056, partial [Babjeviella inositovora NRRL Y-12698]
MSSPHSAPQQAPIRQSRVVSTNPEPTTESLRVVELEPDAKSNSIRKMEEKNPRRRLTVSGMSAAEAKYNPRYSPRSSMGSYSSSNNSGASGASKETEEDVCFPMSPPRVRVNGIDFERMEEFIRESRDEDEILMAHHHYDEESPDLGAKQRQSSSMEDDFSSERIQFDTGLNDIPDRFSFFCSDSEETIHAPDFPSLLSPGKTVRDLFRDGAPTWWLDCVCPTDTEMRMLAKAFGIHPLTAEDIRMQERREKVEMFRNYYFVCFHTCETDSESEEYLEPINVYMVVFRGGFLTFHFSPIVHTSNVRRRVRQLRDYVTVSADWLCYALIDDITDGFAPAITAIEHKADAIEDSVFARELDFSLMLLQIGDARRRVMTLMRLLTNKADVVRMFANRC